MRRAGRRPPPPAHHDRACRKVADDTHAESKLASSPALAEGPSAAVGGDAAGHAAMAGAAERGISIYLRIKPSSGAMARIDVRDQDQTADIACPKDEALGWAALDPVAAPPAAQGAT